jgi:hypothetical protein
MRLKRHGDPLFSVKPHGPVEDRFWGKVKKTEDCWIWTGCLNSKGYGNIRLGGRGGKSVFAHRLSYELHHGPIPDGLVVMHSCDNPACVNPNHLSVGTHKDNMRDMVRKGRGRHPVLKGETNGRALLTEDKVRYIRASKASHAALARELGVTDLCILKVRKRQTWSHVE